MPFKTPAGAKRLPVWAAWCIAALAAAAGAVCLVYAWRVLFLGGRDFPVGLLTAGAVALALLAVGAVWLLGSRPLPEALRGAVAVFLCGVPFVFANPPLQVPDECTHFLRAWSISQGYLDFDGSRLYPEDVVSLYRSFPGAWVGMGTSVGVIETESGEPRYYSTAGYALKQYGEDGHVISVLDGFAAYFDRANTEPVGEPIVVMILPFIPQALGIALARLLGFKALGCLYGGRLVNLLAYAALCGLALRRCRRARPLFLTVMLMPLGLYMAASLSYDATLLGCYYIMLACPASDEFTGGDAALYLAALVWVNLAKPWINLLWLIFPLLVAADGWRVRLKKLPYTLLSLGAVLAASLLTVWYGNAFRTGYGPEAFARMTQGADQLAQLTFLLRYLPRFMAVLLGTLYENAFFIGQLGVFGALDMSIELLNLTGVAVLFLACALSLPRPGERLRPLPMAGMGAFCLLYLGGAMTAMYITYTPVAMIRVIGLQARYFLPVFLGLFWLLAQALSRCLRPAGRVSDSVALAIGGGHALLGAVLLFQHYFIGPVYTIG